MPDPAPTHQHGGISQPGAIFQGPVNQGPGTQNVYQYAAPRPPSGPAFTVPFPPNPAFVGRDTALVDIAAILASGHACAITGPGGMGKTQLAAEFAHAHRTAYPAGIFWLAMADPSSVPAQVAALAGPGGLDLPGWDPGAFETNLAAVRAAWQQPGARLLIFDTCEDLI